MTRIDRPRRRRCTDTYHVFPSMCSLPILSNCTFIWRETRTSSDLFPFKILTGGVNGDSQDGACHSGQQENDDPTTCQLVSRHTALFSHLLVRAHLRSPGGVHPRVIIHRGHEGSRTSYVRTGLRGFLRYSICRASASTSDSDKPCALGVPPERREKGLGPFRKESFFCLSTSAKDVLFCLGAEEGSRRGHRKGFDERFLLGRERCRAVRWSPQEEASRLRHSRPLRRRRPRQRGHHRPNPTPPAA